MQSYKSVQYYKKPELDFYRLNYPKKKRSYQPIPSIRSTSLKQILLSPDNEEINQPYTKPKKQVRRHNSILQTQIEKQRIMRKYRQKMLKQSLSKDRVTFKKALSSQTSLQQMNSMIYKLPLRSIKDIQQFSSKNLSLKQSISQFKEQKNKINLMLLSQKQSEQAKLTYLQVKKKQLKEEMTKESHQIFDRYFRREYEAKFGKSAYQEFQRNINNLIKKMSHNVFG